MSSIKSFLCGGQIRSLLCAITNCKLDLLFRVLSGRCLLEPKTTDCILVQFLFVVGLFSFQGLGGFFVVARVLRFSKGIGSGLLAFTARPKTECPVSQPAEGRQTGRPKRPGGLCLECHHRWHSRLSISSKEDPPLNAWDFRHQS